MREKTYKVENLKDFNLKHIFECGQCFRWNRVESEDPEAISYKGISQGKYVTMTQVGNSLIIDPCTKKDFDELWYKYLDLDRNYGNIKKMLLEKDNKENSMKKVINFGYGIRLLQQDLWETIVSFIISQNNNIPRIKGCIERLCQLKGDEISLGVYDFPKIETLANSTEEELAKVRLGYRSGYLIKTARQIMEKGFPKNQEELLDLHGVGPKVANCISLFGLRKYDSFPIDVWVKRVMSEIYGIDEKNVKEMKAYAEKHFGDLGGFAQQYLFYYMRSIGS